MAQNQEISIAVSEQGSTSSGSERNLLGDDANNQYNEIVWRRSEVISERYQLPNDWLENSYRCFIHKVPRKLVVKGDDRYEPHAVSIGPYHYGKDLEITTEHKARYLNSFFLRSKAPDTIQRDVDDQIRGVIHAARKCYSQRIDLGDEEFAKMLILDGCFILQLLCQNLEYMYQLVPSLGVDFIYDTTWILPSIRRDLVLLENQIPLCVLECLFDLIDPPSSQRSICEPCILHGSPALLLELITSFFNPVLPTISEDMINPSIRGVHLLDILRKRLLQNRLQSVVNNAGDYRFWDRISCATDLQEAGVNFKVAPFIKHSLLQIVFDDGKFEIPPFYFGESWTVLLPNIIALEQCCREFEDEFTSYAILMSYLINSQDDVKLFRRKGIISGSLKEDEHIANVVKDLGKNVIVDKFYYDQLCYRVNAYRKTPYHSLRARFMRHAVHTPWGGFSVAAAISLLMLTTAQTVFAVLSWRKQN